MGSDTTTCRCRSPPPPLSPNSSRRFVLGASNVCLVGENPTCSVSIVGIQGVYGGTTTAMHDRTTPHSPPRPGLSCRGLYLRPTLVPSDLSFLFPFVYNPFFPSPARPPCSFFAESSSFLSRRTLVFSESCFCPPRPFLLLLNPVPVLPDPIFVCYFGSCPVRTRWFFRILMLSHRPCPTPSFYLNPMFLSRQELFFSES